MRGKGKKKQDINEKEMRSLISAMQQPQFRDMLSEYIDEISDPKGREEYQQYLTQQQQRNDLPPGTKLIRPTPGFCLKTMAKKIVTHTSSQFFQQKVFINICASDEIAKPQFIPTVQSNGQKGSNVSMPYHYSQGRPDRDSNNALCYTYDCVFNPRVIDICHGATPQHNFAFKKFVCDTAIDGLNKILSQHNQKASGDYKIMVNMKCKGTKPATLSVKISDVEENKGGEGFEMDPSKHKTKLEKQINKQVSGNKPEEGGDEAKKDEMADVDDEIPFTDQVLLMEQIKKHGKVKNAMEQRLKEEIINAKKPVDGQIIEPSYKIIQKYGVDYSQFFGKDQNKRADNTVIAANAGKRPSQIEIKIYLPTVKSIKKAVLDINERQIKFKYKNVFQLVKKIPYVVDADKGTAKYDKNTEVLIISVPVVSLLNEEENTEKSTLIEQNQQQNKNQERINEKTNQNEKVQEQEEQSQKVIEVQPKIESQAFEQIYKTNDEQQNELKEIKDKIKFFPSELNRQEDQKQQKQGNLIEQVEETQTQISPQNLEPKQSAKNQQKLDWDNSQRMDSEYSFKQTSQLIFVLLNIKKYNKSEVHYILTQDELFLQVWDPNQLKIKKTCIQLTDIIVPENSKVELLNNYISVKMEKQQKGKHWNQIGIDVSQMKPIQNRRINSNFLGQKPEIEDNQKGKDEIENKKNNEDEISDQQEDDQEDDKRSETTLETSKVEQRLSKQQISRPKPSLIPLTSQLILQIS